jgi:hypothetical protein
MFFDTPRRVEIFQKQFTEIDGQYYFQLTDVDWMLPISQDVFFRQTEIFGILTDIVAILTYGVSIACGIYIFYNNLDITLLWIFVPVLILQFLANFASYVLPNIALSRRLITLAKQSSNVREEFLIKK